MNHEIIITLLCLVIPLFISLLGNMITISMYASMKQSKEIYRDTCSRLVSILEEQNKTIKELKEKNENTK